jgi:hypothetical protein
MTQAGQRSQPLVESAVKVMIRKKRELRGTRNSCTWVSVALVDQIAHAKFF